MAECILLHLVRCDAQVANVGDSTSTFYVACHSYTPNNVNASAVLLHPIFSYGRTVKDIYQFGNTLLFGALNNIFRSAAAVSSTDYSLSLFFAEYPSSAGNQGSKVWCYKFF